MKFEDIVRSASRASKGAHGDAEEQRGDEVRKRERERVTKRGFDSGIGRVL